MPHGIDPMHAARLAQLEGALLGLLREAGQGEDPNDMPDGISVTLDASGLDVEYRRGPVPVGGEGL